MGFRLVVLSWWTPKRIISRELDRVSELTTAALMSLLKTSASEAAIGLAKEDVQPSMSIEERRFAMAKRHATLIKVLEKALGRDKAMELGRDALFEVGRSLGAEARKRLGVGDGPKDLIRAARIMYQVLGIHFTVERLGGGKANLIVDRCALSKGYSEFTCLVMSATDEGVVRGLNPRAGMRFEQTMTGGRATCVATVEFGGMGRVR